MRKSKLAQAFMAQNPDTALQYVHTMLELSNFSAGTGIGKYALPFHAIRMMERSGDSKKTVGWYATLAEAINAIRASQNAENDAMDAIRSGTRAGAETMTRNLKTYYVRDIRNGRIYK